MIINFLKRNSGILLIITLAFIGLVAIIPEGIPLTHDGKDHIARIANFYQSLSDGQIIPRWGGNLNWGFGHPVMMFLYPLPSYAASFFHLLGFSLTNSVKLVFVFSFIASGITMYIWMRHFMGEYAGLAASILYMFAPYRFVDLYVRGALGEHVAFIFPPLVLYFMLRLHEKGRVSLFDAHTVALSMGIALSVALLVLSHNAVSLMFFPVIILYQVYLHFFRERNVKNLVLSSFSFGYGFLLSSFFWIPAFFEGKYTLRDIVTDTEVLSRFVDPVKLIYSPWNFGISGQFSVQIGFVHIASVLIGLYVIYRLFKKNKKNLAAFLLGIEILFFLSICIMTKESSFIWSTITTLQKFQFPWRFLTVSVFFSSVIGGICISVLPKSFHKKVFILSTVFIVLISLPFINAKDYLNKPDAFYKGVYHGTTDTGESSPRWSVRFMEKEAGDLIEIIDGEATIQKIDANSVKHEYVIASLSEKSRIKDNTLYFPGWNVYINGEQTEIQFQDPAHRGVITYEVEEGVNNILVIFESTKIRKYSLIISVISLITMIFLYISTLTRASSRIYEKSKIFHKFI